MIRIRIKNQPISIITHIRVSTSLSHEDMIADQLPSGTDHAAHKSMVPNNWLRQPITNLASRSPCKPHKTPRMGRYSQTSPKAPRKRFQRPLTSHQHKRFTPPYKTTRHSTEYVRLLCPIAKVLPRSMASTRQPDESSNSWIANRMVRCSFSRISRVC